MRNANRIASELMRIAGELAGDQLPAPSSIKEVNYISEVIEDTLPGAHAGDEYYLYDGDEYWDYIEPDLLEGDFSDKGAYEFLVDHDSKAKPIFRCVFGVNIEAYNEHWSGRHNDYDPSYDTGAFPNGDCIAVFASIEDKYDGEYVHHYDVTGALSPAALSSMQRRINEIDYNSGNADVPAQGTGHLDDDF